MADQREEEMLELMQDCTQRLRQLQNTINEIWAEWTRTHGLKGIREPEPHEFEQEAPVRRKVVRRG